MTDDALTAWSVSVTGGKRGGQTVYLDLAVETWLTLPPVRRVSLRQTKGPLATVADLLGAAISISSHTTIIW